MFLMCSCAMTSYTPPKASLEARKEITLQSNKNCDFYVDGVNVGKGKHLRVLVSNRPHQIVCKPEGYIAKEEYIQPPYKEEIIYGFTFLIEDQEGYQYQAIQPAIGQASSASREVDTLEQWVRANSTAIIKNIDKEKTVAVLGFVNKKTGKPVKMSSKAEDLIIQVSTSMGLQVVNRAQINAVLQEQRFQSSDLVSDRKVKIGQLAGAFYIISGSFTDLEAEGYVLIHVEVTRVKDGIIVNAINGYLRRTGNNLSLIREEIP